MKSKRSYQVNQVFNSFNLGIQLSYFKNKSQRLELEKLEMANEILKLRAKLIEKRESK